MVAGMQQRLDERGDQLAIVDEFGDWTWSEFNERVNRLIHGLRGLGLGLGDTMCVVGNNRHEWLEAFAAGSNMELVLVPVNWHFSARRSPTSSRTRGRRSSSATPSSARR